MSGFEFTGGLVLLHRLVAEFDRFGCAYFTYLSFVFWNLREAHKHRLFLLVGTETYPPGPQRHRQRLLAIVGWLSVDDRLKFASSLRKRLADFLLMLVSVAVHIILKRDFN